MHTPAFFPVLQIILLLSCVALSCGHLPVVISRGAFVTPVRGVTIYNDIELIHHIISDLPNPPTSIAHVCPVGATQRSCDLSHHIHKILEDNSAILTVLNRARTTFGLMEEDLPNVKIAKTDFRPVKEHKITNDPPTDEVVKAVERSWYDHVQQRLSQRSLLANVSDVHHLNRRWIQYVRPVLVGAAAMLGADDLMDLVGSLFVGENGILKYLTTLQAATPDQSLVDLSNRVSEFESSTRSLVADILKEANEVKKITGDLQLDIAKHKMDLSTMQDSHIVSQQMMSDMGTLLFTYAIYFSFMDSDTNCRNEFISPVLLPPHLLGEKLIEVAAALPSDLRLAVGLDKIQNYYTTKCATCLYDSHGGVITVSVPVVFKAADYQLFEYRNIFFAWEDRTCTLESSSRYIIKDVKSNEVFPVEDTDEERCSPHLTKRCKVPPASDSSESYCVNQLLASSTVSQIRDACKMTCFDKQDTIVSKLYANIFIGVHVQPNTLSVECQNHPVFNITERVRYGTLRIILNCACVVRLHKRTVGRSSGPACIGHESIAVDILLPGHWTRLTDYLPFTNDGTEDGTKFQDHAEILNEHYYEDTSEENGYFTAEVSIFAVFWNFVHSFLIAYIMFKMNVMEGNVPGAAAALQAIRGVDAADTHYCRLQDDVYYLLYAVCALCCLAFLPPIICKFYNFLSKQFWVAVDAATNRRIADGVL